MKNNDDPKIWVTITEKINIGNYESVEVQAGLSKAYSAKEDPVAILNSEIDNVRKLVKKKSNKIRKNRK